MNDAAPLRARPAEPAQQGGLIKLAVMAVGGQGGGVLTGWIERLARDHGFASQATSVAGVAQRTGATIYYIEMAPSEGGAPVFALAPAPGDVDILIASELMEAGRGIQRGFVTPDRTLLIGSTHRALVVTEKTVPGDGTADRDAVIVAAREAARDTVFLDMERLAKDAGSVISASLFGALAGTRALPFDDNAFEDAIRAGGRGVEASLQAFRKAVSAVRDGEDVVGETARIVADTGVQGPPDLVGEWEALMARVAALPASVRVMAEAGMRKVVDFQDTAYGGEYLDHLGDLTRLDDETHDWELTREAAKYLSNAMAYDDVIGVADKKTRAARLVRIAGEMAQSDGQLMRLTEYMHPRGEEIAGLLPWRIGSWIVRGPGRLRVLDRVVNRGRRVRTDRASGFVTLWMLAGLRRWRRGTLRHADEMAHVAAWLDLVRASVADDYDLAVEVVRARRLIKGYSDTHARGLSKYDRVLGALAMLKGRDDAADWLRRLREAALKDEDGEALDGALATIGSFA